MSTLKVDNVEGKSGTTVTVPAGQTLSVAGTVSTTGAGAITVADNAVTTAKILDNNVTLAKMVDGTQGGTLYYGAAGAPTELAAGTSGQFLQTSGSGANPVWATVTIPAAGLSQAQQWRISSNFSSTNTEQYFYQNWEKPAAIEFPGTIGGDMVVDATASATLSGAWTFPVTGTWYVRFFWSQVGVSGTSIFTTRIYITDDNGSAWVKGAETTQGNHHNTRSSGTVEYILNVADVSTDKTRFSCQTTPSYTTTVYSDADANITGATFLRLGDAS